MLLAVIGIERCIENAFAFSKARRALSLVVVEFVEFIGLPVRKPFHHVVSRSTSFHAQNRIHAVKRKTAKVHLVWVGQWFWLGSSVGRAED
jgi:hypothetical protein